MIRIDLTKCTGCSLCVCSCGFDALFVENGKAAVRQGCTSCGMCVTSCPAEAISAVVESETSPLQSGILVFAQTRDGAVLDVSLSLLQKARQLAGSEPVYAAVFGHGEKGIFTQLIDSGADIVLCYSDERMQEQDDGLYAAALMSAVEKYQPAIVLFGATSFGRSVAPRLAARLKTGLTADCTELSIDEKGLLRQTRPAFGGNLMATIVCPNTRPQMASVRPGVFSYDPPKAARTGEVVELAVPEDATPFYRVLSSEKKPPAKGLGDACIIVTAGRGIGDIKNMKLVNAFAQKIGAHVAVTRPLADAGFGEQHQQIGQTGQSVSPDLLITLGVSGAIQHLAGIGGAKRIIAVNTDPDAPIFSVADCAIVGDCLEMLRQILA